MKDYNSAAPALFSLAQYSEAASAPARSWLSFPRACLACARNPERSAWTGKKIGTAAGAALNEVKGLGATVVPSLRSGRQEPLRAAATRENDRASNQQKPHCHYISLLSIVHDRVLSSRKSSTPAEHEVRWCLRNQQYR